MITAHAPAGYIGAQLLYRLKPATVSARAWSLYGVASGLLPDIDMLWFYLVDHGHVHHHRYPTHWPLLWLLALVGALHYWRKTRRPAAAVALLVAVNGMVHMLLDSIVGDIFWLMPWCDTPFSFVHCQCALSAVVAQFHSALVVPAGACPVGVGRRTFPAPAEASA